MNTRLLNKIMILVCTLAAPACYADLMLSKIFSDHMVLQRDQATRIWGWSDPGAMVDVCLINKCYSARAESNGAWELQIEPQVASGPVVIEVKSGTESVAVNDVYFGDLWLAGGQSNMEWTLRQGVDNQSAEIADSNYQLIRQFKIENQFSPEAEERIGYGHWRVASPETVADFSAVAWFFAKKYYLEKNVAVGIISSNWGGTPAEAWVSPEVLLQLSSYKKRTEQAYKDLDDFDARVANNKKNEEEKFRRLFSQEDAEVTKAHTFTFNDKRWNKVDFPSQKIFDDVLWLRKTFELEKVPGEGVIIDFGDLVQVALIYLNEELIATEDWNSFGSRHEIPATKLKAGENLISIRLTNAWFNRVMIAERGGMHILAEGKKISIDADWRYSNKVENPLPEVVNFQTRPGFLYNAMIHPIRKMSLSGVIWYQGESNVGEAPLYGDLFKALINNWRQRFDNSELPFLFVQIAGFGGYGDEAAAELRYQQSRALSLPYTGMATAVDLGDPLDIHPRNKQGVSERLWLNAKKVVFDDEVVSEAPSAEKYAIEKNSVVLKFDKQHGHLRTNNDSGKVVGFELADKTGIYHAAEATIKGNMITVVSDKVKKPKAIRYGWKALPEIQLYSEYGLPVLPFKIEKL